ncbi:hypothetical protein BH09PAT4_BH09PAT4_02980 [soil metagenome]
MVQPEKTNSNPEILENFNQEAFMSEVSELVTPERQKIVEQLCEAPWFQATDPELQRMLATLPDTGAENHDGFLQDLANRPSNVGGVTVKKMIDLPHGNFALLPVFEVENPQTGQNYTYEYISWRYGPQSGAKGIVFVRPPIPGASPTHFITLVGERFAPGRKTHDAIGGFADIGVKGVQNLLHRFEAEIREETGVTDLSIDEVSDLGPLQTDTGMTNNRPNLFTAYIDTEEAARIPEKPVNGDIYELDTGALVIPMQKLKEFILENTDAFFQAAMLKAIAKGEIPYEWLTRTTP